MFGCKYDNCVQTWQTFENNMNKNGQKHYNYKPWLLTLETGSTTSASRWAVI